MKVFDWLSQHPGAPFRVIMYTPAPDIVAEDGSLVTGGEGVSTVVFDSAVSGDFPFDLCRRDITTINTGDDGIPELEYIPDEYYYLY